MIFRCGVKVPKELRGTLFRNSPKPQYAPRDNNYHWFLGDGMIHAFHVEEGRVSYRNRWVRTPNAAILRSSTRWRSRRARLRWPSSRIT